MFKKHYRTRNLNSANLKDGADNTDNNNKIYQYIIIIHI
jgi:hypothetical protein